MNTMPFDECLVEWLENYEHAQAYLDTIFDEYLKDHQLKPLLRSLRFISLAQGTVFWKRSLMGCQRSLNEN